MDKRPLAPVSEVESALKDFFYHQCVFSDVYPKKSFNPDDYRGFVLKIAKRSNPSTARQRYKFKQSLKDFLIFQNKIKLLD